MGGKQSRKKYVHDYQFNFSNRILTQQESSPLKKRLCFLESNFIKVGDFDYALYSTDLSLVKLFSFK